MRRLDGTTDSVDTNLSKLWEIGRTKKPGVLLFMGSHRGRTTHQIEVGENVRLLSPLLKHHTHCLAFFPFIYFLSGKFFLPLSM